MPRFIYFFGDGQADGGNDVKHLVGGKGASLADMTRAGLNVPPGFTISAECCDLFYKNDRQWPDGLAEEVRASLERLETLARRRFGDGADPLLVAVRSGAAHSMPGMMDTVLNVGLHPACIEAMAERTGNPRGAWDAYRHFLAMFGHTVAGIPDDVYAGLVRDFLRENSKSHEEQLDSDQMCDLCGLFLDAYRSHAGQDMPTEPWDMLVQAIHAVFGSWMNERAITYRQHHKIEGLLGTAVNVQMMCPSEVSGVMFTANPVNPALEQILIESSYGLGEAIVLGKVTPDRFVLDKKTLAIVERTIAVKDKVIATVTGDRAGGMGARDAASLTDSQIHDLSRLGLGVENYFGHPCDIEWGLSRGQFYLLQARAIKGAAAGGRTDLSPSYSEAGDLDEDAEETERIRQEEMAALRARAEPTGTVWSRYNLAEILPEPTPMTWAIVRGFMSGKGGYGQMYRDFGFDPDPALNEDGVFELICGRVYCNLSREPRMQSRSLPFEHKFADLKANPHKALYPKATFSAARAGWRFWLFLPVVFFRLWRSAARVNRYTRNFADRFRNEIVPPFLMEVERETARDYSKLDAPELLERFHYWVQRTLHDFARESLKPTLLAGVAMENLESALTRRFAALAQAGSQGSGVRSQGSGVRSQEAGVRNQESGVLTPDSCLLTPDPRPLTPGERAQLHLRELTMGVQFEPDADLAEGIRNLALERLDRDVFIERFGHRGSQEMELARPRWSEDPAAVDRLVLDTRAALQRDPQRTTHHSPLTTHHSADSWDHLLAEAKLPAAQASGLEQQVQTLRTYLSLREAGKHYLLQGYALIRRALVELDRRFELEGGIFYVTPEELAELGKKDFRDDIARRRRRRELALRLPMPQVLFSDDLDAIGRPSSSAPVGEGGETAGVLQGVPLSAGVAEGEALVLEEPSSSQAPAEPYILVCPSTDPAWVPLFVNARGLVMETGGVLSHGAIVAREFGLPAVAGLPGIHRRLRTGQRLRVDGASGRVTLLA